MFYLQLYFGIGLIIAVLFVVRYFLTPLPDRYDLLGRNLTKEELDYTIAYEPFLLFLLSGLVIALWPLILLLFINGD